MNDRKFSIAEAFNGRLFFSCGLIALSQVNFGMDQAAFSSTQAMEAFTRKFGEYDDDAEDYTINPSFLSLLNSLIFIGFAVGLVTGSFINRRFGRRMSMFVMCLWALVGATVLVTADNKAQMLAGRIVAYVYIGMELAVVPVLQSELVPARVRGFVVGTYQAGLLTGQLIMSLICRGTSVIEGDASWRIPLGLLYVIPSIVASLIWFMPESPRLLLMRDRPEKAFESLRKLRIGRFTDEEINQEFRELQDTINLTVDRGHWTEMFQGSNLRRTLITIGANVFMQITGQNFVNQYQTIFLKSLHTVNPFSMASINTAVNIFMTLVTMVLNDTTGRVPLMFSGAIIQTAALITMGSLGTIPSPTQPILKGITSMVTIFGVGYQLGWAPLSHVVAAEVPTSRLRDMTYALGACFNVVIQFAISFSIPYLLYAPYANLGAQVGFIFGGFAVCAVVFSWFCVPEVVAASQFNLALAEQHNCTNTCQNNLRKTLAIDNKILFGNATPDDTFYATADNFPTSAPGDLLKLQPLDRSIPGVGTNASIYLMQYTSIGLNGTRPVPATAFIALPLPLLPRTRPRTRPQQLPLIAYAHGFTGLTPPCAPSRTSTLSLLNLDTWSLLLSAGYAVVAPDYAGLGNNFTPHLAVNPVYNSEDVYFAVVAARNAFRGLFTSDWAAVGHSQGGGAVWGLNENPRVINNPNPNPGGNYLGGVAMAPAARLSHMLSAETGLLRAPVFAEGVFETVGAPVVPRVMTPEMRARAPLVRELGLCLVAVLGLGMDLEEEEQVVEEEAEVMDQVRAAAGWFEELYGAGGGKRAEAPLLVLQGLEDRSVLPEGTRDTVERAREVGNVVDVSWYPGVDHDGIVRASEAEWMRWLRGRFEGSI
ncbi:hypothetical protein FE257_003973 [Aspergillus nanangensis]|uniref:Major facilitator superfamily (MFS) profile domain-containing protein n=1 Tax=Aspergillus nanangensis TaxID=2582783 RepID=A0AAD4GW58_ASPNN|nr:hypothetical protein FE257_003973 [Aspergillus nanangensis]